jgi:hypothetical protein
MMYQKLFRCEVVAWFAVLTVLIGGSMVEAQTDKGTVMIAGSAGFSSSSGDLYGNQTMTQVQFMPAVYGFAADNFAVGGRVNFVYISQGDYDTSTLLVGPALGYFFPTGSTSKPFVSGAFFYNANTVDLGWGSSTSKGSTIAFSLGMAFFPKPHFAITSEFGVNFQEIESVKGTTFLVGLGVAGFIY